MIRPNVQQQQQHPSAVNPSEVSQLKSEVERLQRENAELRNLCSGGRVPRYLPLSSPHMKHQQQVRSLQHFVCCVSNQDGTKIDHISSKFVFLNQNQNRELFRPIQLPLVAVKISKRPFCFSRFIAQVSFYLTSGPRNILPA